MMDMKRVVKEIDRHREAIRETLKGVVEEYLDESQVTVRIVPGFTAIEVWLNNECRNHSYRREIPTMTAITEHRLVARETVRLALENWLRRVQLDNAVFIVMTPDMSHPRIDELGDQIRRESTLFLLKRLLSSDARDQVIEVVTESATAEVQSS